MKLWIFSLVVLGISVNLNAQETESNTMNKKENLEDGLYARFSTNKGDMMVELYETDAPITVANFVGLAEGTIDNTAKAKGEPFYNGTIFHRVIKDFMIQGGDPDGTGRGGPGYKFMDEQNEHKHDAKGVLSMANSGPNTNGSQFFITEVPTPWLNGKHTIFGRIIDGVETLDAIANTETAPGDKPVEDIVLKEVDIIRVGDAYKNYDGGKVFTEKMQAAKDAAKKQKEALTQGMTATDSGLMYKITQKTDGAKPKKGDDLKVHYEGKLLNGTVFDSSFKRGEPISFPADSGKMIPGWDEGVMLLNEGERAVFYIPSNLAYGQRGIGPIPPNSDLIFELELVKIN